MRGFVLRNSLLSSRMPCVKKCSRSPSLNDKLPLSMEVIQVPRAYSMSAYMFTSKVRCDFGGMLCHKPLSTFLGSCVPVVPGASFSHDGISAQAPGSSISVAFYCSLIERSVCSHRTFQCGRLAYSCVCYLYYPDSTSIRRSRNVVKS